jgi:hypothetical protein
MTYVNKKHIEFNRLKTTKLTEIERAKNPGKKGLPQPISGKMILK